MIHCFNPLRSTEEIAVNCQLSTVNCQLMNAYPLPSTPHLKS
ncbi:hypothetical protein [Microcoleus sp. CAWBG58]|nr:hypothetical protein [Microcoleus sp. CAWBG58]